MRRLPRARRTPLPPLTPAQEELRRRLAAHVAQLAGEIGERNLFCHRDLVRAASYIETELETLGFVVESQSFEVGGQAVRNLEIVLGGAEREGETFVVGGHYDSVLGSPGANDNATGAAALLEIARLLRSRELSRPVRIVAFVNEEPPFFQTADMGSYRYARRCSERGDRLSGMLCLETIGCYSSEPGSQAYPFPLGLTRPDTGDFIGFVANLGSRALLQRVARAFRRQASFPFEAAAAPGWLTGVGWSDHWAFWQFGYRAVMATDTAPFRYPHYHTAADTLDKIDYGSLARVVAGLAGVVEELAGN